MLARVADNLFWMGRYLERTEHIARFVNVNYFSSLDAPNETSQSRQFVLNSILRMVDDDPDDNEFLDERTVLYDVVLNPKKMFSIKSCFRMARENASGARDLISSELFESINKLHHYISNYSVDLFLERGLDEFTSNISKAISTIKGKIVTTMMHNEVYSVVMLGVQLERATDVIRIIDTKHQDAIATKQETGYRTSYEWTTLLKGLQSFDMMKRYYKKVPTSKDTLDFLILNPECPKSVMSCLNSAKENIDKLSKKKELASSFLIGKITAEYKYKSIDEIETSFNDYIQEVIEELASICTSIENELFNH
ncbi:putative alpha-E superfamily protein [Wenyingzhuangia heitensis]|uniref:Alpha-E superfamily protein n=1 Tax=Wenyingzhuangia heitensis TaxID=1487859 RepID=A0ABX0U973_9FLAO|nr:alpha-E domain-containing protein [Wenyingzhuangia heitensis]NIJ45388.1 putative alpha-E superfamily protein [Wenyingzhuangia heitensis]